MTDLRLRPMRIDDEQAVRAAQEELAADHFTFALFLDDLAWPDYLDLLRGQFDGTAIPDGMVRAAQLVAEVDGEIVGRLSVRHELNAGLARFGGHAGYGVRPAFRGRGYATALLEHALDMLAGFGVDAALVSCDDDNVASAAVIERCGGVLRDTVPGDATDDAPKRRYDVPTRR